MTPTDNIAPEPSAAWVEGLLEPGECCVFCGRDPYHYVDIGVGRVPAAVECCDLGIGLYQHRDELLGEVAQHIMEAAYTIQALRATGGAA